METVVYVTSFTEKEAATPDIVGALFWAIILLLIYWYITGGYEAKLTAMKTKNKNSKRLLVAVVDLLENLDEFDGRCTDQEFTDNVVRALLAYCGARDWDEVLDISGKFKTESEANGRKKR